MGCDIHLYAEKRDADGNWKLIGEATRDEPLDPGEKGWISGGNFYDGRNYNLFAILADVRNGRGFAGCKTGEGFVPISAPRGIPEDASPEVKEIVEQWDGDGHSHSYHTLRHLLDFDWTQRTQLQGWVDAVAWAKWSRYDRDQGNGPHDYCGGVSGGGVKHVSAEEMDELLKPVASIYSSQREEFAKQYSNVYALAQWGVAYHKAAENFFSTTIPRLLAVAGGTAGLDDVRIVFFFDN